MARPPSKVYADIRKALLEVDALMSQAFAAVGFSPDPGSALEQIGLRDGAEVVLDYLDHGEPGLALEHLIYMVREPSLPISRGTFFLIDRAGRAMGITPETWQEIRPLGGD